jgi:pantetheine-phosphate adenylyltransferase
MLIHPVYAGSYDPYTFGHHAIAMGAYKLFGSITLAIGKNSRKKSLFTYEEKVENILDYFPGEAVPNIVPFEGLLADYCRTLPGKVVLIRGLRAVSDFEQEMAIADANHRLSPGLQTIFIPTEASRAFISSSVVKEIALNTKNVNNLVPYVVPSVAKRLLEKVWATES